MKGDPEERAAAVGRYIVESGATVRAAAAVFGVSKSTIWKDQHRLAPPEPGPLGRGAGRRTEEQGRASSARRRGHTAQIFAYSILRGARRHSIIK